MTSPAQCSRLVLIRSGDLLIPQVSRKEASGNLVLWTQHVCTKNLAPSLILKPAEPGSAARSGPAESPAIRPPGQESPGLSRPSAGGLGRTQSRIQGHIQNQAHIQVQLRIRVQSWIQIRSEAIREAQCFMLNL